MIRDKSPNRTWPRLSWRPPCPIRLSVAACAGLAAVLASSWFAQSPPGRAFADSTTPVNLLATIRVRVYEADGVQPFQGATVKIAGTARGAVTGAAGVAEITSVSTGPVRLAIHFFQDASIETTIVVGAGETTFSFQSPARPSRWVFDYEPASYSRSDLVVFVRSDSTKRPIKGMNVFVRDAFGHGRRGTTNRKGKAVFKQVTGREVPVWTRDTLGYRGVERFVVLAEVRPTQDTLYLRPAGAAR